MFSANEARPKYNANVLKERYENDKKYFRIHTVFNPTFKKPVLAGKFYSPYDTLDLSQADPELLERIALYKEGVPKDKFPAPVTGNQVYGWVSELLVPLNKADAKYYQPRNANISKINVTLKKK